MGINTQLTTPLEEFAPDEERQIRPLSQSQAELRSRQEVAVIAAVANDGAIGCNGHLLCHISADLKRFKALTAGHTVIMGRKTFESLPKGALPNRRNIVITRSKDFSAPGVEVAASPEDALRLAAADAKVFVIGGGEIYRQMMPFADTLLLTHIELHAPDADAHFPEIDPMEWVQTARSDKETTPEGVTYWFEDLKRR